MTSERAVSPKVQRGHRKILWCVAALVLGVFAFEATLRVLVYTDVSWGKSWRSPGTYSDRWNDPFYFQLNQLLTGDPAPLVSRLADPRLGWIHEGIDRQNFAVPHELEIGSRRPVLLFGASFVRCMTDTENCFEGWMERSELRRDFAILNYGVRGYGIDQTALLVRLALPHWENRNAVVAIGIFVEDDLDRTILDFRGWPKPRFTFDKQGNLIEPEPVPTEAEYAKQHPLWSHSLAWGWLIHRSGLLPSSLQGLLARTKANLARKQRLSSAILDRVERDLVEAGVEHFYVLFPSVRDCESLEGNSWQETLLLRWLDERRLPFVNVRRDLLEASLEQDRHPTSFFGTPALFPEHLTPDGNEVAFRAVLRGLERRFDHTAGRRTPHPLELHNLDGSNPQRGRFELGWSPRFPDEADRERIVMQPTVNDPVRFGSVRNRPARRFVTTAKLCAPEAGSGSAPLRLEIRVNRESVYEVVLDKDHPSAAIDLDVLGKGQLEIIASRPDQARALDNFVVLARPHFE